MKKIFALVLTFIMVFSISVNAASGLVPANLQYNNIKINLNGNNVATSAEPFIIDGTTYLPVRALAEALGLAVEWDAATSTVKLSKPSNAIGSGTVLYEQNGVRIVYMGMGTDWIGNKTIKVQIQNYNNFPLIVQIDKSSIDGIMTYGMFSCNIEAGKVANDEITFYSAEEDGVTEWNYAELMFYGVDSDTYHTLWKSDLMSIIMK